MAAFGPAYFELFYSIKGEARPNIFFEKYLIEKFAYFSCVKYMDKVLLVKLLKLTFKKSRQLFLLFSPSNPVCCFMSFN